MEATQRAKYLNALGVVQYRRRSLAVVETLAEQETQSLAAAESSVGANANVAAPLKQPDSAPASRSEIAGHLMQELEQVKVDLSEDASTQGSRQTTANSKPAFGFDLLVWRTEKILVLEFSAVESEQTGLKHRLANNILKALWPQAFKGVELHQHSWPMQGVAADIGSATEWLNSLIAGHRHQAKVIPIWLMGDLGMQMLFPDHSDELTGSWVRHDKLGADLLVTQGLKHISESTAAKAQLWQLLKTLRP